MLCTTARRLLSTGEARSLLSKLHDLHGNAWIFVVKVCNRPRGSTGRRQYYFTPHQRISKTGQYLEHDVSTLDIRWDLDVGCYSTGVAWVLSGYLTTWLLGYSRRLWQRVTPVMARGTNQRNVGRRGTYRAAFVTAQLYVHTGAIPTVGVGLVTRDKSGAPRSDERSRPLNDGPR